MAQIELLHDPLLSSIFKQGTLTSYDAQAVSLTVEFPKSLTFFSDIIDSTAIQWQPLFAQILGSSVKLVPQFTKVVQAQPIVTASIKPTTPVKQTSGAVAVEKAKAYPERKNAYAGGAHRSNRGSSLPALNEPKIDVSNTAQWPHINALLAHFPGTVTQIRDLV